MYTENQRLVIYFMLEVNESQLKEVKELDPSNEPLIATLENQNKILKKRIRTFENK